MISTGSTSNPPPAPIRLTVLTEPEYLPLLQAAGGAESEELAEDAILVRQLRYGLGTGPDMVARRIELWGLSPVALAWAPDRLRAANVALAITSGNPGDGRMLALASALRVLTPGAQIVLAGLEPPGIAPPTEPDWLAEIASRLGARAYAHVAHDDSEIQRCLDALFRASVQFSAQPSLEPRPPEQIRLIPSLDDPDAGLLLTELGSLEQRYANVLALASHDLRSPIAALSAFAELLQAGELGALSPEQRDAADAILEGSAALDDGVRSMVDGERLSSGIVSLRLRPSSLEPLVESAVDEANRMVDGPQQAADYALEPDLPSVLADPIWLRKALLCLLAESRRFKGAGADPPGEAQASAGLLMRAYASKRRGWIRIELERLGSKRRNTGYGEAPSAPEEDEEPRTRILRSVVRLHGGSVEALPTHIGALIRAVELPIAVPGE